MSLYVGVLISETIVEVTIHEVDGHSITLFVSLTLVPHEIHFSVFPFFNLKVTYVALTLIAKVRDFLCSLKHNHVHLFTVCRSYLMKVLKFMSTALL